MRKRRAAWLMTMLLFFALLDSASAWGRRRMGILGRIGRGSGIRRWKGGIGEPIALGQLRRLALGCETHCVRFVYSCPRTI